VTGFPTVVYYHGGGLNAGRRSIPAALKERGWAVAGVSYRLHPKVQHPVYIEDAAAALAWVFKNIESHGGDASKIFVTGISAGGYLTAMVGLDTSYLAKHEIDANRIAALIPVTGQMITHQTVRKEQGIEPSKFRPTIDRFAPLYHVRNDAPPTLCITGGWGVDMLMRAEENLYFVSMMKLVGHNNIRHIVIEDANHSRCGKECWPHVIEFIEGTLAGSPLTQNDVVAAKPPIAKKLVARAYDSGFDMDHDTWNGMGVGSDGRVYYVLCSESVDRGGQMFSFDPATERIRHVGDLTEACGEKGLKAIPQGKSHATFVEHESRLFFATHLAYYNPGGGDKGAKESMAVPPPGYKPYPGGHFLSYDLKQGTFQKLASAPHGEGILSMTMDVRRGRLYGLTWPTGYFLRYDLATKNLKTFGPIAGRGEAGEGPTYSTLCRAIVVNPDDGSAYLTTSDGDILRYRYDRDTLETVAEENLRKDYFGVYDPTKPGHMGYNWRQAFWHPTEKVIYGVHGNSGYLFRFDPRVPRVELLERLTSEPSRRRGMNDRFRYGYLAFTLGPDGRTIYYLTGGPIPAGQKPPSLPGDAKRREENLHLVTYDIPTHHYTDHGPIFFADGQWPWLVHSIAVGKDGSVYALSRVHRNGRYVPDLIRIPTVHHN